MQAKSTLKIFILFTLIYFSISGGYQCNINNCATCSYPNACGICNNNFVLTLNTTSGYFYCNPVTCPTNCTTCYQNNICQTCNDNFFLTTNGSCSTSSSSISSLPANCLVASNMTNCQLCSYGYTLNSGFCYPNIQITTADQNCLVKMTSSICQICVSPYIVGFLGNCVQATNTLCSTSNCLYCYTGNSTCLTCNSGFQLTPSNTCVMNFCNINNCLICANSTQCQTCMSGYILSNQTCMMIGYGCNIKWCTTCSSSQSCGQCQIGYQLVPFLVVNSTIYNCQKLPCPFNISNCMACTQNYNSIFQFNQVLCGVNSCMSGYVNVNGFCVANVTSMQISCIVTNCQSCSYNNFCGLCQMGYALTRYGSCISTMCNVQNCQSCSLNNICQQCMNGYTLTNGNIALLNAWNIVNSFYMVNQMQCTLNTNISCNVANCNYCTSSNVCGKCSNGYDFDASLVNCIMTCNVSNCYQCSQGQNFTSATCLVCQNGYTLSSTQMQCTMINFSCGSNCGNSTASSTCVYNQQTNSGQCLQCNANMILYNGTCSSPTCNIYGCNICAPWAPPNTLCLICQQSLILVDGYCVTLNCNNGVPNCVNCIENGRCIGCQLGYYLQNSTNGTVTCVAPPSKSPCILSNCVTCQVGNPNMCTVCATPYIAINGMCVCNFQNCLDCSQSSLTCNLCPPPLVASLYESGCTPQPSLMLNCSLSNCEYCLTTTQCSICTMGYSLNSTLGCTLNNCSMLNNCQLCDVFGYQCYLCNTGYMINNFLQGGSCSPINQGYTCNITGCAVCSSTNNSLCATCLPTYHLNTTSNMCVAYSCNITNCHLCLVDNSCTICLPGYYLANNKQCMAKFSQIINCQGSISYCDICVSGLYISAPSSCIKCMDGFQYNSVLNQCLPQQNSIPNCLVQIPNYNLNNLPMCIVCQQGYYINSAGLCSQYNPMTNNTGCNVYNCLYCGLNSSACSFCFVPWGISSTGLCQTNISIACTQANCNTCANSSYCTICTAPYTSYLGSCNLCNITGCSLCQANNSNCSACLPTFNISQLNSSIVCIACNISNCINCSNNNICRNCQSGYNISTSGSSCVTCGVANCLSCSSSEVCGVCINGFQLNNVNNIANNSCITCNVANCITCTNNNTCSQCTTGYTPINGSCLLCLYPCATCYSNLTCATCVQPAFYSSPSTNGSCFAATIPNCITYNLSSTTNCTNCSIGYSLANNTCQFNCSVSNCSACVNGSSTQCSTCVLGFYLSPTNNSNCISCGTTGCVSCNATQCLVCLSGFYNFNGQCKQCPSYCSTCTSYDSCSSLINNNQQVLMTINQQVVLAICPQGCQTCSSSNPSICQTCVNGLYFLNGACLLCNQICLTCSTSNTANCISCYPNSFLNGTTCITCSSNCQSCLNSNISICTSCFPGFYLNNTTCVQGCPLNCLTCSSLSTCTLCATGYTLFGTGTCAPCVTNCRSCAQGLPASCITCGNGFYLSGSTCIQCTTNCASCSSAGCGSCIQGFFLTSALTCSVNCQLPCATCSANVPTRCTSCIAGYSYSSLNNQCIPQITCNGAACSVCPIGYILQSGECASCNVNNCQLCLSNNVQQCSSCAPGYYLNSNGCIPCMSQCATCLRGNGCTSCATGFTYNSLSNIQSSGYQCIACQSPCLTCLNSTSYCTSCVSGYTFTGWKCTQTFFFGFSVTLTVNSTLFNQNYYNFVLALTQAIGSSNPNIITITGITFGSVIVDGGVAPTASSASLQSNQQYNSLNSALSQNNQIAGMTVGSSSITVVGGSIEYDKLNLALILGICIPVGVLIIVGISLYIYCKKKRGSQVIETKIKQDSGFTVRQSFQLSQSYKEKDSSRPFEEFTSIN